MRLQHVYKDAEAQVKDTVDKRTKNVLAQAMQRLAGDYVTEQTVTTVHLPDDNIERSYHWTWRGVTSVRLKV